MSKKKPLKYRKLLKQLKPYGVKVMAKRGKGSEVILLKPSEAGSKKGPQYPLKHHSDSDELEMQNLGVVSGVESIGLERIWKTNTADKFLRVLRSNGKVLIARHDDPGKVIKLQIYLLTSVGQQILQLGKFEPHLEYLRKIGNVIHDQGFSVTLGDYVQISDTTIKPFNEVLIEAAQQGAQQADSPAAGGTAA